ncbi:MAG: ATP-binding protein [Ignavibacteria bacterium]|nr:ATP-binding protein [Ignavibacteria bacterium]
MKNKSLLSVYGILLAIMLGGSLWLYFDLVGERERILSNSSQIAIEKSKFMSQWLRNVFLSSDYVLRDVREKVNPNELIHSSPLMKKQINLWLGEKAKTVFGLSAIGIYDSSHIYRADNVPEIIGFRTNLKMPTSQNDDKVTFNYMPPEKSANKKPTILISRGIFSQDGKGIGGIAGAIDLEFTQSWIQSFHVDSNDALFLIDEDCTLLAHNSSTPGAMGNKNIQFQTLLSSNKISGSSSSLMSSQIDGIKRIYGITRLGEIPIVLVVGYDINTVLKEWRHRTRQISCGFFVLMILVFFVVRAYMKSLDQGKKMLILATKAEEANSTKDKFFSIIAHDLRGPFTSMLGFSEIMRDSFENNDLDNQRKYFGYIHEGIKGVYKLLDNLLLWAKLQRGGITSNPEDLLLKSIVDETIEPLRLLINNKSITFLNQIPDSTKVYSDKNLLSTIIRNLVSNAIKFTQRNGCIFVSAIANDQFVEISIKDDGTGIPKDKINILFDISKKTSTTGTEGEPGTGLGLLLCKDLVEKQNGKIWVESEVGKGSTFSFTIPLINV